MPDANILWLDLYHICEMLGLLVDDDDYPDEDEMRGRLRDRYITHWQHLRQQPEAESQQESESSPFMVHPETEEESVCEITVFENNESETMTPGGQAPPLKAVVAEEDDNDDDEADLSVFIPAAQ